MQLKTWERKGKGKLEERGGKGGNMPCPLHTPWLILIIFGEEYKLRSSSSCSPLQPPVTSSPFAPNILSSTLFSNTPTLRPSFKVKHQVWHRKENQRTDYNFVYSELCYKFKLFAVPKLNSIREKGSNWRGRFYFLQVTTEHCRSVTRNSKRSDGRTLTKCWRLCSLMRITGCYFNCSLNSVCWDENLIAEGRRLRGRFSEWTALSWESLLVLLPTVQILVNNSHGLADVGTKFHRPHRPDNMHTDTVAMAADILWGKSWKGLPIWTMYFIYP
jgi:hypothetical protein